MPNTGPKTGESHPEICDAVRKLCARFPGNNWNALDRASGAIRRNSSRL
jgi:hypothetical protein